MNRREFISGGCFLASSTLAFRLGDLTRTRPSQKSHAFEVRVITKGPKHHWFGYYDKLQFDPTDRLVLSNQVHFEHRTPRAEDSIKIGMVDTAEDDKWIELGSSRAWGWQQGCMLQWVPGSPDQIIWNDRGDNGFISHILNVNSSKKRTLPCPVYTLSPDGQFGLSADFARIQIMRPGYGYVGQDDLYHDELAPKDSGVFKVDLQTGDVKLILSLADVAKIPYQERTLTGVKHYFNHLLIAPDSKRFIVLHRWRKLPEKKNGRMGGFVTRMITANLDGSDVYVLDPSGHTSHFIWRDSQHVCMWTKPRGKRSGFYLYKDKTREIVPVGADSMTQNGHNTYLANHDNTWILNDTYPDQKRNQTPYLFHVPTSRKFELGPFHLPEHYKGEWRCDTHPRSNNDGRKICIDSPYRDIDGKNHGRQLHLIDVGSILDGLN